METEILVAKVLRKLSVQLVDQKLAVDVFD